MIIYPIYSRMWTVLQFSVFLVFSFIEDFVFFSSTEKRDEKGKYTQIFWLSIDLLHVKDFKRNLTDGNLIKKCVFKETLML